MNEIIDFLKSNNKTISTMESCTGGFIANEITNISGSSDVFKYGAVAYSNEAKIKMGVSASIIDKYGVYSMQTAKEMSKAISIYSKSDYGVGITGLLNEIDNLNEGIVNDVFISIYHKDNYYTFSLKTIDQPRINNKLLIFNTFVKCFKLIQKKD
jgi:PncC family amidohydrolase